MAAVFLLLVGAAGFAAVYARTHREVTTSSEKAYRAWQEAIENERRFYFKEARVGFARALELDPQFAMAMIGLARNSEPDQQILLVKRAARERDRLTPHERLHVDLSLADIAREKNRFMEIAREIHKEFPDDLRVAGYLAGEEMKNGNFERSLQIFGEVLAIDPNIADAYNQIGYYYGYHGDYEKAILNLKKYQFISPDKANPFDSLGEIQAYSGHYDEAIENSEGPGAEAGLLRVVRAHGRRVRGEGRLPEGDRGLQTRLRGERDGWQPGRVSPSGVSHRRAFRGPFRGGRDRKRGRGASA